MDLEIQGQMSDNEDGIETAEFNEEYNSRHETHKTIEEPSTPPFEEHEDYETMVIIEKFRKTGAEFNTQDLK